MTTINTIIEEIKDVPINRLEELHLYIKSLIPNIKKQDDRKLNKEDFFAMVDEARKGPFTKLTKQKEKEIFGYEL